MSSQTATTLGAANGPPSFDYDAFISYRRSDGAWHARTLRQRLQDVRVPADVASTRPDRKLRIYLDQIFERATDDFFEDTIKPALAASRHLVVVKTPSTMNVLPDGHENWLVREIEYFCSLPPEGRSISVAIASGDLTGALPAHLDETHPNIERLDLRRWRRYRTPAVDDQLLSLAATLHEIRPSDMPALRQEDARRVAAQKRTRRLAVGTAAALVLAATSAAIWQYLRVREESYRRDIAVAASLWNRLNFTDPKLLAAGDLNALWEIRLANAGLRDAFITELINGGDRGSRLGRRPAAVMRAVYFQWPEEQAAHAFDGVLRQTATTEPSMHEPLWVSGEALARALPAGRVSAAVQSVLDATKGRTEWRALPTLRVLASNATPTDAQAILASVLKQTETASDPGTLKPHWAVASAFGAAASPQQAVAIRAAAVRAFESTTEPDDLEMLSRAVAAPPGALTADDARRVMAPIAKQIAETTWAMQTLGEAVAALAPALPADAAASASDLVLPKINGSDPFASKGLGAAIAALAPMLGPDRLRLGLDRVLSATAQAKLDFGAEPFVHAIAAMSERLPAADAHAMLPAVLSTISRVPIEVPSASIDRAVRAIVTNEDPPQAERLLAGLFGSASVAGAGLPYSQNVMTSLVRALGEKLSPGQKSAVAERLSAVCGRLQPTADAMAVLPLESIAAVLGAACVLPPAPTATLEQLLATMLTRQEGFKSFLNQQNFRLMSKTVTPDQARTLLTPALAVLEREDSAPNPWFVEALRGWFDRGLLTPEDAAKVRSVALTRMAAAKSANGLRELATLIAALPGRLTPEQGQVALASILKADETSANISDFFGSRRQMAEAVLALAPQLTSEQRQTASSAMRSELAWAENDELGLAAAKAAIELAPREPDARAAAIIEMLKYPTAASGGAAKALLAALHDASTAGGSYGRTDSTFAWISASFPRVKLDAPPECPEPRHGGLARPATATVR